MKGSEGQRSSNLVVDDNRKRERGLGDPQVADLNVMEDCVLHRDDD